MKLAKVNPRSIGAEGRYITTDIRQLAALRNQLLEQGHAPSVANGIVGWLVGKAVGAADTTGAPTRARYRKILGELTLLGWTLPIILDRHDIAAYAENLEGWATRELAAAS